MAFPLAPLFRLPERKRGGGCTDTDRQKGDHLSLLLFIQNKETKLKIFFLLLFSEKIMMMALRTVPLIYLKELQSSGSS
jgi:hypothetical protein